MGVPDNGGRAAASDEELMAEVRAGRQEALQELHRRHAPRVFRLACGPLGMPAAEEITQDVFLRLWQKAEQYDPAKGDLEPWLLQIARRRVLDELRERGRRPQPQADSEASLEELAATDAGPDQETWQQFRRSAVQRALAALPEDQRRALRLAFFQDLSHEQVARLLDVPLGTAKGRIRLGLAKLNGALAGLVAPLVAALGLSGYGWLRQRIRNQGDQRALDMLTGSRMQAMRLLPPAAPEALAAGEGGPHGVYRAEPGGRAVVFTLANLPPAPHDWTYRLWRRAGGGWQALGDLAVGADGRARLVLDQPGQPWPEQLRLTLERQGPAGTAPAGASVLEWQGGGTR
jgi:RNA polymerase sigma-70 factor (ECF subfamily)